MSSISSTYDHKTSLPFNVTKERASLFLSVMLIWGLSIIRMWLSFSLSLDSRAHFHGLVDDFFTPWHLVMYTSLLAMVILIAVITLVGVSVFKLTLKQFMPKGMFLNYIGIGIFAVGGVADMVWHTVLGIEFNFEAVVSLSHITLMIGFGFLFLQPFYTAYFELGNRTYYGPLTLSVSALLALICSQIGEFVHPLYWPMMATSAAVSDEYTQAIFNQFAMISLVVQAVIPLMFSIFMLRRWRTLPLGTFTFIWTWVYLMAAMPRHDNLNYVWPWLIVGIALDILPRIWDLGKAGLPVRLASIVLPAVMWTTYLFALNGEGGTHWSVYLITGAMFFPSVVAFLASYLVIRPGEGRITAGGADGTSIAT